MTILLVANRGSLFRLVSSALASSYSIESFVVDGSADDVTLASAVHDLFRSKSFDCVVFISGETRDACRMERLNVFLPSLLAHQCHTLNIPFIGLSSLAVFGIPKSTLVHESSARNPCCFYGATKNMFDLFLMNSLEGLRASILLPGSIINPASPHNLFLRWQRLFQSYPLITRLLQFISPSGLLPCIHIDDLVAAIVAEVGLLLETSMHVNHGSLRFVISSFNVPLHAVFSSISHRKTCFLLPSMHPSLVSTCLFFLPPSLRKKFVLSLSSVGYGLSSSKPSKYGSLLSLFNSEEQYV
jgi:hypothetical protein